MAWTMVSTYSLRMSILSTLHSYLNSITGCYDPLCSRIIIEIINWFSVFPWVVHFFFTSTLLPIQAARPVNTHHVRGKIIQGRKQKKREKREYSGIPFLKIQCSYKTQKDLGHRLNV